MLIPSPSRIATRTAVLAAVLVVSACSARSYPEPSEAPPPPPPPPSALMGEAPSNEAPNPPPAPAPLTDPAQTTQAGQPSPPVIIAMEPIPNPPEDAPPPYQARPRYRQPAPAHRFVPAERPRATATPTVKAQRNSAPAPRAAAPAVRSPAAAAAPAPAPSRPQTSSSPAPAAPSRPAEKQAAKPAAKPAAPGAAAPRVATPAPPSATRPVPAPGARATGAASDNKTPLAADAAKLAALELALVEAVVKDARLTAPDQFTAGQPAEVTLVLPATFARTLSDEAAKNGLSDAAAAVNMTAELDGDGFVITPNATQSQPLVAGQPTQFRWTVTPNSTADRLRARVGAELVGSGSEVLYLGWVDPTNPDFKVTPRVWGAAILALIAALLVAAVSRGRRKPARPVAATPQARRDRRQPPKARLPEDEFQ